MKYTFVCCVCSKQFSSDEPGEPCCTGPSETRDDHPLQVMRLLRIDKEQVNPTRAEERAVGRLWVPSDSAEELQRDARLLIAK